MNVVLVYNEAAGSALQASALRAKCRTHGITIDQTITVGAPSWRQRVTTCAEASKIIAVYGGDGTLSAVAGMLFGTKAVLAPLPGGTLNHFTKDLSIPQDIDAALQRLAHAATKTIDIATVNDTVFINNSSLGLYPTSLRERDRFEDRLGKWPAAVIGSFRAIARLRTYTVTINNETFHTPFIFVGNNTYEIDTVGGVTRREIDQGTLSVFIARTASRVKLIAIAFSTLVGQAKQLHEFDVRTVSALTVETKRRYVHVAHDGEVSRIRSPLHYKLHAKALRIK